MAEAEESGAAAVLALLRAGIASKSIRVIELFNSMDTSKDGLISRCEPLPPCVNVIRNGRRVFPNVLFCSMLLRVVFWGEATHVLLMCKHSSRVWQVFQCSHRQVMLLCRS